MLEPIFSTVPAASKNDAWLKAVKIDSKICNLLCKSKPVTHYVDLKNYKGYKIKMKGPKESVFF